MSVPEFRAIFAKEINSYVTKTQRKSMDTPTSGTFGSPGSTVRSQIPTAQFDALRNLAGTMADRVLQRVANHASEWGVDEGCNASPAEEDAMERRCKELEEELNSKRAEEAKLREDVVAKCKEDVSNHLQARERELLEVANSVMMNQPSTTSMGKARENELVGLFQEHMARIHARLADVQQLTGELEDQRSRLERLESQQERGAPSIEVKLGSGAWDGMLDEQDKELARSIEKGEQVCKRMRRHAGAMGA